MPAKTLANVVKQRQQARNYEIHRTKIERMKPTIDNAPPMTSELVHIKRNLKKKAMVADRNRDIQHENKILVDRMTSIAEDKNTCYRVPFFEDEDTASTNNAPSSMNIRIRRDMVRKIQQENYEIFKRITSVKSGIRGPMGLPELPKKGSPRSKKGRSPRRSPRRPPLAPPDDESIVSGPSLKAPERLSPVKPPGPKSSKPSMLTQKRVEEAAPAAKETGAMVVVRTRCGAKVGSQYLSCKITETINPNAEKTEAVVNVEAFDTDSCESFNLEVSRRQLASVMNCPVSDFDGPSSKQRWKEMLSYLVLARIGTANGVKTILEISDAPQLAPGERADAEEEFAATKLQAMQRGKKTRIEMQEKQEQASAATKLQAIQRGKQARQEVLDKQEQELAATKLQAIQRGKLAREEQKEKAEQDAAAAKLQAIQRGKMQRGKVAAPASKPKPDMGGERPKSQGRAKPGAASDLEPSDDGSWSSTFKGSFRVNNTPWTCKLSVNPSKSQIRAKGFNINNSEYIVKEYTAVDIHALIEEKFLQDFQTKGVDMNEYRALLETAMSSKIDSRIKDMILNDLKESSGMV